MSWCGQMERERGKSNANVFALGIKMAQRLDELEAENAKLHKMDKAYEHISEMVDDEYPGESASLSPRSGVIRLRDEKERLQAQNAKLREQVETLRDMAALAMNEQQKRMAKLREAAKRLIESRDLAYDGGGGYARVCRVRFFEFCEAVTKEGA